MAAAWSEAACRWWATITHSKWTTLPVSAPVAPASEHKKSHLDESQGLSCERLLSHFCDRELASRRKALRKTMPRRADDSHAPGAGFLFQSWCGVASSAVSDLEFDEFDRNFNARAGGGARSTLASCRWRVRVPGRRRRACGLLSETVPPAEEHARLRARTAPGTESPLRTSCAMGRVEAWDE